MKLIDYTIRGNAIAVAMITFATTAADSDAQNLLRAGTNFIPTHVYSAEEDQ